MKLRVLAIIACVAAVGVTGIARHAAAGQEPGSKPIVVLRGGLEEVFTPIATPPEITIQDTPAGPLFADRKGFTLYIYERDKEAGKATCVGPCAEQWVPLRAEADTKPFGDWSLAARTDGRPQWAYQGRPLYRYRWEAKPRWAEAQNDSWRYATVINFPTVGANRRGYTPPPSDAKTVLPPSPGGVTFNPTRRGNVFSDAKNLTLYSQAVVSPCTGSCLDSWIPLSVPAAASPIGDWTIVTRPDGSRQWAFQGRPLYRYVKDIKPSDVNGENAAWRAAVVPSSTSKTAAGTATPKPAGK